MKSKGKLSAYQRWEMTSFEEKPPEKLAPTPAAPQKSNQLSQQELDAIRLAAQKQGFAQGFEEGHTTGLHTGEQEGRQALELELSAFLAMSTQFNQSLQQAEHLVAQNLLIKKAA